MKFYIVCWYDYFEKDLSPCYGDYASIVVSGDYGVDLIPMFTTEDEALQYREKCRAFDGDDYYIVEIDVTEEV